MLENVIEDIRHQSCQTQCLKITEKVSFDNASEASYVCILSGQKLMKYVQNRHFGEFLKKEVLPDRPLLIGQNGCKMPKNKKCDILINFPTMCVREKASNPSNVLQKKEKLGYLVNFRLSLLTGFLPGMGF